MEGSPDPRTDGELLAATVTDPEAFAVFYRRHVRGVLSFFRRRVPSAELAFDLTAETFAAALEATPRYQPRPEPARGWLYGIAWNKLHETRRRGYADDAARRGLSMAPIELTDAGIERIEALAGGGCLRERGAQARESRGAVHPRPDQRGRAVSGDPIALLERELVGTAPRGRRFGTRGASAAESPSPADTRRRRAVCRGGSGRGDRGAGGAGAAG